jgi:hypothetical protein
VCLKDAKEGLSAGTFALPKRIHQFPDDGRAELPGRQAPRIVRERREKDYAKEVSRAARRCVTGRCTEEGEIL